MIIKLCSDNNRFYSFIDLLLSEVMAWGCDLRSTISESNEGRECYGY